MPLTNTAFGFTSSGDSAWSNRRVLRLICDIHLQSNLHYTVLPRYNAVGGRKEKQAKNRVILIARSTISSSSLRVMSKLCKYKHYTILSVARFGHQKVYAINLFNYCLIIAWRNHSKLVILGVSFLLREERIWLKKPRYSEVRVIAR